MKFPKGQINLNLMATITLYYTTCLHVLHLQNNSALKFLHTEDISGICGSNNVRFTVI